MPAQACEQGSAAANAATLVAMCEHKTITESKLCWSQAQL